MIEFLIENSEIPISNAIIFKESADQIKKFEIELKKQNFDLKTYKKISKKLLFSFF